MKNLFLKNQILQRNFFDAINIFRINRSHFYHSKSNFWNIYSVIRCLKQRMFHFFFLIKFLFSFKNLFVKKSDFHLHTILSNKKQLLMFFYDTCTNLKFQLFIQSCFSNWAQFNFANKINYENL